MLIGQQNKVFVLDFFGSPKLLNSKPNFNIPPKRLLTAYGSPWNTFLGYYITPTNSVNSELKKEDFGVIWGKDPKHFQKKDTLLLPVADFGVKMKSTATTTVFRHKNIDWIGHLSATKWNELLVIIYIIIIKTIFCYYYFYLIISFGF